MMAGLGAAAAARQAAVASAANSRKPLAGEQTRHSADVTVDRSPFVLLSSPHPP